MTNFEKRLDKHFKRLLENTELLLNTAPESDDSEIIQESFRIMTAPQNEEELTFADAYLSLLINTSSVAEKAAYNETKIAPIKENRFVKALIEELIAINEDERDYDYTPYQDLSMEEAIVLTYDAATFPGYEDQEVVDYLCRSLKIAKNDDNSKYLLAGQLEEIQFNINLRPLSNNLSEHMKKVVELSKLFKRFSDIQEIKKDSYDEGINY